MKRERWQCQLEKKVSQALFELRENEGKGKKKKKKENVSIVWYEIKFER